MERALYGPDGFYERGGQAGRRGDFLTSPEVGPLFGTVLARALGPDVRSVVEFGGGVGTLARDILAVRPELEYVIVERSTALRAVAAQHAPVAERLPPGGADVILANELLDNLPFDLFEFRGGQWMEVRIADGAEHLAPAAVEDAALIDRLVPEPSDGDRVPLQHQATAWLDDVLGKAELVVMIDYCDTTPSMAARPWPEWLRTYKSHGRGTAPHLDPGSQYITTEVAVDQLALVAPPTRDRSQADFLRAHGIDELVDEARRAWQAKAAAPDLSAFKARSRVTEAQALTDPGGLGAFRVLEWDIASNYAQ